ncbi:MAG: hypothetical protein U0Q18_27420 [Bryobacteraceae bacterium]
MFFRGGRVCLFCPLPGEILELAGFFRIDDVFARGQPVAEAIAAGASFAGRGAGTGGFAGVAPIGFDLSESGHC